MDLFMFNCVFCPEVLLKCLGGCRYDCLNLDLQQLKLPKKPVCYVIPGSTDTAWLASSLRKIGNRLL